MLHVDSHHFPSLKKDLILNRYQHIKKTPGDKKTLNVVLTLNSPGDKKNIKCSTNIKLLGIIFFV